MASHALHHTNAYILASRNVGEANRFITLFSEDLGLIKAVAQGVRLAKSKLKGGLYTYAHTKVSVVRGREVWRITGAQEISRNHLLFDSPAKLGVLGRIYALVLRLVHGEEPDPALYEELGALGDALSGTSEADLKHLETVAVLRILNHLGYLKETPEFEAVLAGELGSTAGLEAVRSDFRSAVSLVNRALADTQL